MKKGLALIVSSLFISNVYANVPYCAGTETPSSAKNAALQYVVEEFAHIHKCRIGNNCLLNYQKTKYSIAWDGFCKVGAGSTFICDKGYCYPYGYSYPIANY